VTFFDFSDVFAGMRGVQMVHGDCIFQLNRPLFCMSLWKIMSFKLPAPHTLSSVRTSPTTYQIWWMMDQIVSRSLTPLNPAREWILNSSLCELFNFPFTRF